MNEVQHVQLPIAERVRTALSSPEVEAEFRALAEQSVSIISITNEAGYQECHAARMRLVKARTSTAKRGKEVREDAQAFAKAVIAEEKRLIGILEPEEERLAGLQRAEDEKREAKIRAEQKRVEIIQQGIAGMGEKVLALAGKPAAEIAAAQVEMQGYDLSWAMEFLPEAQAARDKALLSIGQLHAGALAQEKAEAEEAARIAAEKEELARLRAEQAKRDAEAAERAEAERKAQAEARAKLEAEERAAREKREAEDRAAQAERDRLDAEARAQRAAEEKRLNEAIEKRRAEQAAEDARLRREREEIEAREREARRQEAELADGQTLLTVFKERFGKRREFSGVVKAIDSYFAAKQERERAAA